MAAGLLVVVCEENVSNFSSLFSFPSLPLPPLLASVGGAISFTSSNRFFRLSRVDALSRFMMRMRFAALTSRPVRLNSLVDGSASSDGCDPLRSVTPLMLLERIEWCG